MGAGGFAERTAEFAQFLRREERSPATVRTYQWGLSDLEDFLASRGVSQMQAIGRSDLETWQDRLLAVHLARRSRSLATTAVRQFLKWGADHDYCDPRLKDWLASVRVQPLKPKPIPDADLTKLLAHYAVPSTDLEALRNRAMFMVYLSTGLRVSEGLRLPRTGYERGMVRQKGGGEKLVTVPEKIQAIVREYLAGRVDASSVLFVTHPGAQPMTPAGVRHVWHMVAARLAIAPFHTHQIRHTFATQLLAQGIDIRVVAELMGHKNIQSTMIYTEVREAARQDAMKATMNFIRPEPVPDDPRVLTNQRLTRSKRRGRPRFRIAR